MLFSSSFIVHTSSFPTYCVHHASQVGSSLLPSSLAQCCSLFRVHSLKFCQALRPRCRARAPEKAAGILPPHRPVRLLIVRSPCQRNALRSPAASSRSEDDRL